MKSEIIKDLLICPACRTPGLQTHDFEAKGSDIVEGVVVCSACREWYRIEGGVLELLVRSLQDKSKREAFSQRFKTRWKGWTAVDGKVTQGAEGDPHKLEQKAFYDGDAVSYEGHMIRLPFWTAFDHTFLDEIRQHKGGLLVEFGCGTGRMSLNVATDFETVLGFDISESMVRTAIEKRDRLSSPHTNTHYFIADAENVPVRTASAMFVLYSGILHHIGAPRVAIHEGMRVIKAGGRCLGVENNRSALRPVFDLMMRLHKLWNEKAHEDHFILSGRELALWLSEAGFDSTVWTSVFLPPHVFNLFSYKNAERLLRLTDKLLRRLPGVKDQGGLLLFSGCKSE